MMTPPLPTMITPVSVRSMFGCVRHTPKARQAFVGCLFVRAIFSAAVLAGLVFSAPVFAQSTPNLPAPAPAASASALPGSPTLPSPTKPSTPSAPNNQVLLPVPAPATPSSQQLPGVQPAAVPSGSAPAAAFVPPGGVGVAPAANANPKPDLSNQTVAMPAAVDDAVRRLQKTDMVNMDDMARAQDAVNRLDLLLEIQKRQNDLNKLIEERKKASTSSLFPAGMLPIPKAALMPDRADMMANNIQKIHLPKNNFGDSDSESYSVLRVTGVNGIYAVLIQTGGQTGSDDKDKTKLVHVGDTLPDGSKVKLISLTRVVLAKGKKLITLSPASNDYIVRE